MEISGGRLKREVPAWMFTCSALCAACIILSGCAGAYFRDAGRPPVPPPQYDLAGNPNQEYWTGIVFSGDKIGFSHFRLAPAADAQGRFEIASEAVFSFRFLMMDKKVSLKSYDLVRSDLSIDRFEYDYDIDGSLIHQTGEVKGGVLLVKALSGGRDETQNIPIKGTIYPASIMYLYPALHGLDVGRSYEYQVYNGETRTVSTVKQEILAYEESDLFEGKGFKMKTGMKGQEVTSWVDTQGRPLLETALGGVIISGLESESRAKRYLASSSVNKDETLINFSLIRSDMPIAAPRQVKYLEVAVIGTGKDFIIPTDGRQQCSLRGDRLICRIVSEPASPLPTSCSTHDMNKYLKSTFAVPASDERIKSNASRIIAGLTDQHEQVRALIDWIQKNIEQEPVDVFTAIDVLEKGRAECQGHAILYAAFARSMGIPTRVVNGIVYSEEHKGFLYHSWAESCVGNRWISLDPTFGQIAADATHIKFVEGETPDDLLPIVGVIGKIRVEILSVE
jgi:hypothetical protein